MFVGYLLRWSFASRNARTVDEDIDLSVSRGELIRNLRNTPGIRHVHDGDLGIVAFRPEAGGAGLARLRFMVGNDDFRSRLPERLRACESDPLPAPGDDGDTAAKL